MVFTFYARDDLDLAFLNNDLNCLFLINVVVHWPTNSIVDSLVLFGRYRLPRLAEIADIRVYTKVLYFLRRRDNIRFYLR